MLTYAFDLLYRIYEEEGYNPPDIPRPDPREATCTASRLTRERGAGRLRADDEGGGAT